MAGGLRGILVMVVGVVLAVACSGDDSDDSSDDSSEGSSISPEPTNCGTEVTEPELRDELLEMQEADQFERTAGEAAPAVSGDQDRTDRLREIIEEQGWPACDEVGEDGASAAWVIVQHSDQHVEFQQEALELMRAAAADGLADATEVAYLEDRVAVNTGEPQRYGTQVRCSPDGNAEPQPLEDPDRVDQWREEAGMEPLDEYLVQFEEGCVAG